VLLAAAGVGVHLWVMPLDVLITWREPTGLAIKTDPTGATVRVDGVPLPSTTPATISVWRDRNPHVIEASRPGYKTARETVRYDKAAQLSFTVHLDPDPNAPAGRAEGLIVPLTSTCSWPSLTPKVPADTRRASPAPAASGPAARVARTRRARAPARVGGGGGFGGGAGTTATGTTDARRGGRSCDGEVGAQAAHHLAADALDADQLVDGAEGVPLPVGHDLRRLRRTDAGQEAQRAGVGRVEVDDPVDALRRVRRRRDHQPETGCDDDRTHATHARFSAHAGRGCLVRARAGG
jgi:hypothetical protein